MEVNIKELHKLVQNEEQQYENEIQNLKEENKKLKAKLQEIKNKFKSGTMIHVCKDFELTDCFMNEILKIIEEI